MIVLYQDLLDSDYSLKDFSRFCSVSLSNVKQWKSRGIPKKYHDILRLKILKNVTNSPENVTNSPENVTSRFHGYFSDKSSENRDLDKKISDSLPLLLLAKCQAKFAEQKSPDFFAKIESFKPNEITTKDKKLLSETDKTKSFVDCNGEILNFTKKKGKLIYVPNPDELLVDRFHLQSLARELLPDERISDCLRKRIASDVPIHKSIVSGSTFFSNLATCTSIWSCTCCAAKISERRRNDVKTAIDSHLLIGGQISFCTRTVPHTYQDSFESILLRFRKADSVLKAKYKYKRTLSDFGVIGSIKIYEITVGANGWHLHVHELYFHDYCKMTTYKNWMAGFSSNLLQAWQESAVKVGFNRPSDKHGLQVQNGDFAAEYMAKWGKEPESMWRVDSEISKSHIKRSFKGLSPFDLLRQYDATGSVLYGELFLEYALTIKGQQQQRWSSGLKSHFGIEIKKDKELASEIEETAYILGRLDYRQWDKVIKNNLRGVVLSLARSQGFDAVVSFLKAV